MVACSLAAPAADPLLLVGKPYINSGSASGPVHAAFGDLVSTKNGLRSLALEGFSEDVNQDGFVDPVGQAVVAAPVVTYAAAPLVHHVAAPVVHHAAAPVVSYAGFHYGLPYGLPLIPAVAPAAAEPAAEEAAAVEEA